MHVGVNHASRTRSRVQIRNDAIHVYTHNLHNICMKFLTCIFFSVQIGWSYTLKRFGDNLTQNPQKTILINTSFIFIQVVPKKRGIWKRGTFIFIYKLSIDYQQINLMACTNLVHCGYFQYKTFSDQIWLVRYIDWV